MKTGTKTAVIFTALLAGTTIAGAYPHDQDAPWQKGSKQGCPVCGNPQFKPHHQQQRRPGAHKQHPQTRQAHPQKDSAGMPAILKWKPTAEQQERMKQKHQNILNLLDLNGDGQISESERQVVQHAWKIQQRQNRQEAMAPKDTPKIQE